MKPTILRLLILLTGFFYAELHADQKANWQEWRPVLTDTSGRVASSRQSDNGLALLIYAARQEVFNLAYLPDRAQNQDPVVHFISASFIVNDEEIPLGHSEYCFKNQMACRDPEHIRIQLTQEDLDILPSGTELRIKYQSWESADRNTAWTASLPLHGTAEEIEHLAITGFHITYGLTQESTLR